MSPFEVWLLVSCQLYYTINREEILYFEQKFISYLCGLVAFRKRLFTQRKGGEAYEEYRNIRINNIFWNFHSSFNLFSCRFNKSCNIKINKNNAPKLSRAGVIFDTKSMGGEQTHKAVNYLFVIRL